MALRLLIRVGTGTVTGSNTRIVQEYRVKEATRRQLERLAGRVSPGAKLLAFGSMANGFALRNSDMDLCYLTGSTPDPQPSASELVEILAQLIREETDFNVMPLPKARIPIIKISRSPTPDLPYEIACDIGFENRLALENTRLLLSYAMVDPPRLRTMVLFLKVWTKRRKLNSPYTGTLSSYGYTLLALYYLTHVKKPPVLPNLQRIWPNRPLSPNEVEMNGHDIYFYDDIATLRNEWTSQNTENVGELLIDFFRYFAKEFSYSRDVISLRTENGTFPKDGINWTGELCIEDPFQVGYNVSRPVTKDGLYTIRGEFIRASKILSNRNQRASTLIAELCKEREDGLARAPENPRHPHRYPGGYSTFDSPVRRHYANASGVGGSFAFEAMARGLGRGQQNPLALLPTAAMLAPLSHNGGLTGKPARGPRRRGQQNNMSSAKSDDGMQHSGSNTLVVPYNNGGAGGGVSPGGYVLDQAIDLSEEVSVDSATRSARSFSDTLARSKSLPRQSILTVANGIPRHSQPPSPMTRPQMPTAAPGVSPPMTEILAAIEDMSVQQGETPGRHSSISDTGALLQDSPYADVSTRSSPYQYQTHSPWTFLQPSIAPYVPYTGGGAASASARPSAMAASGSSSQQGVGGWGSQGTTPYLVQEPERLSSSSSSQNSSRRPSHGDNVAYADGHSLPVGEGEGAPVKILHSPLALHSEVIAGKTL
ncbi:hypothetical protein K437DRAFT_31654 [Tilletiaria anomala UBC 951]|uniref:polynucleotide adenylyltransferase n=1 Tax=Tilletiaria anomala (strain ATCC 24038 / CBS 436.72 / UBC 951) TaxID=1037660 RepID=A0A066V8Z6_TILAU|nr:uncharacterized protein K437DRAFT_31654 [Tilletiaria anomala UBC 951]KDN37926.1 hypothetical protein K437DRAFT_31654 [Tilletiaria anomala UBC 951]